MTPRARSALSTLMVFGPAALWVAISVWLYAPRLGWRAAIGLALFVAVGIIGLSALFVAWFPAMVERVGLVRLGAWLRTWSDEDAR